MKYIGSILVALSVLFLAAPAYAHESRVYEIGGASYAFVVGSLNEPIVVDDKSGLDLSITRNNVPFEGAETMLKVEIQSRGAKKIFDIDTVWGTVGKYKTTTYYTEAGSLGYRLFGTLENTPVDLLFECMPAGHDMDAMEVNNARIEVSGGVVQTVQRGAFGCPAEKATFEFPAATADSASLAAGMQHGFLMSLAALLIAALSLLVALFSLFSPSTSAGLTIVSVNRSIVFGIGGLLIGLVIGYVAFAAMKPESDSSMESMMHSMSAGLEGKTGDEFDHAFLDEMIVHHEGAVEMAKQVLDKSQRQDLRYFAAAIIEVQSTEIAQMKAWMDEWFSH